MERPPVPLELVSDLGVEFQSKTTHIATSEVTALEHELWDDTVELGAGVALSFGLLAQLLEVLGRQRDHVVVELEVDAAALL